MYHACIQLTLDGGMFMLVYLAGVAKSWMYWPLIAGVMFLWKYRKAKRSFEEENPGQLALAWPIGGQVRVGVVPELSTLHPQAPYVHDHSCVCDIGCRPRAEKSGSCMLLSRAPRICHGFALCDEVD